MSRPPIAGIVPSSGVPSSGPVRSRPDRASAAALPLAALLAPIPDEPLVFSLCRVDSTGRVCDRTVLRKLGWKPGDALTVTTDSGAVLLRRDLHGAFALPAYQRIQIPTLPRARFRIRPGDMMLLTAIPDSDTLVVYPMPLLHNLLTRACLEDHAS